MTISGTVARFISEEHKYRPLPKTVHLLGKQTITATLDGIRRVMTESGVQPRDVEVTYDNLTRQAGGAEPSISDNTFFALFGVETVRAIDHSDFEGADIVFDLTKDLPPEHESSVDFIFDGSVMDNVFDPASAIQNVARLLKPGGRYIGINIATTRWLPAYVAFNPYWFFDFFVANNFADVKIYMLDFRDYRHDATWLEAEVYLLDAGADHRNVHNFPISPGASSMMIIAEKADDSTWNERTSQGVYRLDEEWRTFDRNLERVKASPRPVVHFRKQANNKGGTNGFTYVGTIDACGLFSHPPDLVLPRHQEAVIEIGKAFPGYGWGALGEYEGVGWRWVDGASVVLANPPRDGDVTIQARIHTALDMESIEALAVEIDDRPVESEIRTEDGVHHLHARVEQVALGDTAIEIKFVGNGVALSEVRIIAG